MKSSTPKVLHRLAGLPLIHHVLETAPVPSSPTTSSSSCGTSATSSPRACSRPHRTRVIVDQDDVPGTGRAVEQAVEALPADFDGDVVVVSADVPFLDHDDAPARSSSSTGRPAPRRRC